MSFKHMNIILDLDNTIISAEETDKFNFKKNKNKTLKFSFHNMDDYYIIFERPNIQVFLDFIFKNFNVSIWTAATKDYALFIIENVILKNHPERKIDYIFHSYHCGLSSTHKNSTKSLEMLWDKYNLEQFNKNNTFIIDDYSEVIISNKDNSIHIKEFNFADDNSDRDNVMVSIIPEIINYVNDMNVSGIKVK